MKMKVADAMTWQTDFVKPNDTIKDAIKILFSRNTKGIPVCEAKKLVGFLSEIDIIRIFFPSIQDFILGQGKEPNIKNVKIASKSALNTKVKEIMSKNPIFVHFDTPLYKAQSMLDVKRFDSLPVVDDENKLIGSISMKDVFRTTFKKGLLFNDKGENFLSNLQLLPKNGNVRLRREIPDLVQLFTENGSKKILDIGCGNGDHAIELSKKGFNVLAVDRSPSAISSANKKRLGLKKEVQSRVKFVNRDAEDLLEETTGEFDAVLFLGDTLSYNINNYRYLIKKSSSVLSSKGLMVFQITNFSRFLKVKKRMLNFKINPTNNSDLKEILFIDFLSNPKKERTIEKNSAMLISEGKTWKWAGMQAYTMAYTNDKRLLSILKNEKFKDVKFFGSKQRKGDSWDYFLQKPFEALESDWLNVVATNRTK